MEVKRCARCGNFLTSYDNTCIPCSSRDKMDVQKLKTYFEDNTNTYSVKELSLNTGITEKNVTRYMQADDFSGFLSNENQSIDNISTNL